MPLSLNNKRFFAYAFVNNRLSTSTTAHYYCDIVTDGTSNLIVKVMKVLATGDTSFVDSGTAFKYIDIGC